MNKCRHAPRPPRKKSPPCTHNAPTHHLILTNINADRATRLEPRGRGQRVGASEAAALEAQESLNALREEEAELLARLETNREALIGLLAAIQRIETQTPPAVLAAPEDAADAARAAALMAEVAPALQERADTLTAQIEDKTRQRSGRN